MGIITTIKERDILYGNNASYRPKSLFIEAGAGAGKTDYIIKKIVDELLQGVEPKKFIVITFTNKATEEMLTRIIEGINERVEDKKHYSIQEREILKKAKDTLFEMNVSTIHSFCNKLLNENSFKSKLSYGSILLEEDEEKKRSDSLFYEWTKSLKQSDYNELNKTGEKDLLIKVKATYDVLCSQFDNVQFDASFKFSIDDFLLKLGEAYSLLTDGKTNDNKYNSYAQKFINGYQDFESLNFKKSEFENGNIHEIETMTNVVKSIDKRAAFSGKDNPINDEIKTIMEDLSKTRETVKKIISHIDTPIINKYALEAWKFYKEKRDRKTLSNNQLIYETYKLFENNPKFCDDLAKKYDVIFVDEFQDTDKCQIEFITKLAQYIHQRKKKEHKISTSLIVVGDPKQSIYRFRGADFNSFNKVANEFESYGEKGEFERIFFPDNFRSNNYIINYVNEEYKSRNLASNYTYEPMEIHPSNVIPNNLPKEKLIAGVYSYPFNNENQEKDKFTNLAKFIKYLVEEKYQVPVKKKHLDENKKEHYQIELKNVEYKDFLILSLGHKEMSEYVEALNGFNIPSQIAGEFDLSSSEILRVINRLLFFLLDKENNNKKLIENTLNAYTENPEETLLKLVEETKDLSPYAIFYYLLTNMSFIFHRFTETDKIFFHSISEQVFEKLAVNEFVNGVDLLNKIDELLEKSAQAEIKLDPEENTVRIMNIHKSKGLQGRIVIIVDSGGFMNNESCRFSNSILYLNNLSILPKINDKAIQEIEEERTRLEYVAATRSEQVLIFESNFCDGRLFNRKDNKYNFDDSYLEKYHYPETSLPTREKVDELFNKSETMTSPYKIDFIPLEKIHERKLIKHINEVSPSKLEDHSEILTRTIEPRRPYDNVFGVIFHRVMELYVKNNNRNENDIIDQAINENINDIEITSISKYKSSLKECLESVIILFKQNKYLEKMKEKKSEFKFFDFDESLYEQNNTLMSGSIDLLLFDSNDNALIIDYKTDIAKYRNKNQFETLLLKNYHQQLETYSKVINKLFSKREVHAKIIWMEENESSTTAHEIDVL